MTTPDLSADEKGDVARFGIHDEPAPAVESPWDPPAAPAATVSAEAFLIDHNLTRAELSELLREYRSETGWSAFEMCERDSLDSDFLNWHRWERLG